MKGEGSVFRRLDNGKWYFRLRVKVDGEIRELREEIPGIYDSADAAWRASKDIRHENLAKIARHEVRPSNIENVTCGELLTQYVEHVKKNRPRSAYDIERQVESQLRPFFGTTKVAKLTTRMLDAFIEQRQKQGRKFATIRNDLAYFRSALRLELKNTPCRILAVPHFPTITVDNTRTGFLDFPQYEVILDHLPVSIRCLFVVAYHIGNRLGALLDLKWHQIDFDLGVIFLDSRHGNKTAGTAPIYGDMRKWLTQQKQIRDELSGVREGLFFGIPKIARSTRTSRLAMAAIEESRGQRLDPLKLRGKTPLRKLVRRIFYFMISAGLPFETWSRRQGSASDAPWR